MTDVEDILKHIPQQAASPLHKTLIDIILKSKNAQALPPNLAKSLLNMYRADRLESPEGAKTLLEASILLEKEKTAEKLQELNLNDAAAKVKGE